MQQGGQAWHKAVLEQGVSGQWWAGPDEREPGELWGILGDGKTPSALKESSNIALQEGKDELTVSQLQRGFITSAQAHIEQ